MKKFAAMLMLVCSFGVFAVVGCGPDAKKTDAPKTTPPAAPADKMDKGTTPAPAPAPADKK